jgi:sulfur carrier protein
MRVILNGAERDLPEGATVAHAVALLGLPPDPRGVAVALEGEVVPRRAWAETDVAEGQRVEVLTAVQGG